MMAQQQSSTHEPRLISWDGAGTRADGSVSQVRAVGHVVATRLVDYAMGMIVRLGGTAPPRRPATGAQATEEGVPASAIDRYSANLEVKPIANSKLVQVHFTARDPDLAQAIANAHANEYI